MRGPNSATISGRSLSARVRPDNGHLLADDTGKTRINPGYSLIGRLRGMAELRGVMHGAIAMEAGR